MEARLHARDDDLRVDETPYAYFILFYALKSIMINVY